MCIPKYVCTEVNMYVYTPENMYVYWRRYCYDQLLDVMLRLWWQLYFQLPYKHTITYMFSKSSNEGIHVLFKGKYVCAF